MSDEWLIPVKTEFPVVSSQTVVIKLTDAYYKMHEMFPGMHIDFDTSGFDDYRVNIEVGSLEDAYRIAALLSDAATHMNNLKNIPATTGDKPEVKWCMVDASLVPKKIIYNGPATIVLWADGTKTVVKCSKHDSQNAETGFLWALAEKVYGSKSRLDKVMRRWLTHD